MSPDPDDGTTVTLAHYLNCLGAAHLENGSVPFFDRARPQPQPSAPETFHRRYP